MKDDCEFNYHFIDLVRLRPCLYDSSRSDYKSNNRTKQDVAWLEIAQTVNETVSDCKVKWKNLRACYSRHLKNSNKSTPSGKYSKPYYLAEKLSFLYNFTTTMKANRDDKNIDSPEDFEQDSVIHTFFEEPGESRDTESPVSSRFIKKSRRSTQSGTNIPVAIGTQSNKKTSLRESTAQETTGQESTARDKNPDLLSSMCPDLAFLYSLLPDMKEMNMAQKRKFKIGILGLSSDILQEKENNGCDAREQSPECDLPNKIRNIRTY